MNPPFLKKIGQEWKLNFKVSTVYFLPDKDLPVEIIEEILMQKLIQKIFKHLNINFKQMKKLILILSIFTFSGCAEMQQVLDEAAKSNILSQEQIGQGLKEALSNGVINQVTTLALKDGFYKNEMAKILYPAELQKVDKTLRDLGLGNLADQGMIMLNRAAEDAVHEAIPIFKEAIVNMTFTDAKNILLGEKDAATQYLNRTTSAALRAKFQPIIQNSFQKVGADKVWTEVITTYNKIPLVSKVSPDLTGYVTDESLKSVYKMVAVEESKIRTDIGSRTSELLKKVFALQD